ncbi:hypothetical protein [Dyella sp. 20L07]|uniref:hypothetical protein n=1 Tax=Dyella sp. 20L07 TaxID=3384240 RepID=UPI003D2C1981
MTITRELCDRIFLLMLKNTESGYREDLDEECLYKALIDVFLEGSPVPVQDVVSDAAIRRVVIDFMRDTQKFPLLDCAWILCRQLKALAKAASTSLVEG